MQIVSLGIQNYKSLHHVRFAPGQLNVVVGANASGKSNLSDSLAFVSEIFRHGLEVAVARKGGYENIAYRRMRRSKGAIFVDLHVRLSSEDLQKDFRTSGIADLEAVEFRHSFALAARGYAIRAEFEVVREELHVSRIEDGTVKWVGSVIRAPDGGFDLRLPEGASTEPKTHEELLRNRNEYLELADLSYLGQRRSSAGPTELVVTSFGRYVPILGAYIDGLSAIRVFRINPSHSREHGVPTPRPELDGSGQNLPAVVDLMRKRFADEWRQVMQVMRIILPDLRDINVGYTSTRTFGLLFEEQGVGRPWTVREVSDGTIQVLALLVAIFDPRFSALVLEEPENSIHPWIIRHLLEACSAASESKQIVLTTHSPLVINAVNPKDVWVIWRKEGDSHLQPIAQVDPRFLPLWLGGEVPTFEYLDSGAIPEALPPEPSEQLELGEADQ